jgi:hypothetical protein
MLSRGLAGKIHVAAEAHFDSKLPNAGGLAARDADPDRASPGPLRVAEEPSTENRPPSATIAPATNFAKVPFARAVQSKRFSISSSWRIVSGFGQRYRNRSTTAQGLDRISQELGIDLF